MSSHFFRNRRGFIRIVSFGAAMTAVLFFVIVMQTKHTEALAAAGERLCCAMLAHMSEEHDTLSAALTNNDTAAVRHHAEALYGHAAMISSLAHETGDTALAAALSDTAQFYIALIQAPDRDLCTNTDFWKLGCDTVCSHTASLALAMSSAAQHTSAAEGIQILSGQLSAFTKAFRTDPLRLPAVTHADYSFDRESPVTQAEARQKLRMLIGNAVSFLGNTVTDDAHGCYLFSCQNGYAEISRCGGHLLSYAFYPRSAADAAEHVLNDADLSSLAASFLQKAGIPHMGTEKWNDRHGIRMFSVETNNGKTLTVGIRMHDGAVVRFDAEAYYRREDGHSE